MSTRVAARTMLAVLALWTSWPVTGQGLNDAARRERERREKLKAEGKSAGQVVDDTQLKGNKGQVANATAPAATTGAAPAESAAAVQALALPAGADNDRRQEEDQWRGRMRQAQADVEAMQQQYDMLSRQHLAPQEYFIDPRTGETLIGSPERLQRLVAEAKSLLEAAKKRVQDLEERARREHIPPGWLR